LPASWYKKLPAGKLPASWKAASQLDYHKITDICKNISWGAPDTRTQTRNRRMYPHRESSSYWEKAIIVIGKRNVIKHHHIVMSVCHPNLHWNQEVFSVNGIFNDCFAIY
jgi:hypothetical protein